MYMLLDEISTIQLDHSSRCNLFCPQCARTNNKKVPIADLTIDDYKIILEPFQKNKIRLFHCGNYGDALASPTFDETFDYCLSQDVRKIKIATNGSLRNTDWWKDLAIKSKNKLTVVFSVDGLDDSNHLYRVGSNFKKIIENAQAFINNGGDAEWAFIEFKHNYHQIDEARELAKELGFRTFNVKYTSRFATSNIEKIQTRSGNVVEETETNHNKKDKNEIVELYGSFDNYVQQTPITCKYQSNKTIFIDMCMNLWPCCWMGSPRYSNNVSPQTASFDHFLFLYGEDFNNLRKYGWDVLQHDFFREYLERSWNEPNDKFKRIYVCGRTCGNKFEFSSGFGKNLKTETLRDK